MNALLHRAIVLISGQPDSMATPAPRPLPGLWARSGGSRVDTQRYFRTHCSGCEQGCEFCDGELANDVGLDDKRVVPAPPPLPDDVRSRVMRRTLYLIGLALANARAAEALIVNHAAHSADLAYLRHIARKLSAAMDQLQRELEAAPVAGREPLEGMLLVDIPDESTACAPTLTFDRIAPRFVPGQLEQTR